MPIANSNPLPPVQSLIAPDHEEQDLAGIDLALVALERSVLTDSFRDFVLRHWHLVEPHRLFIVNTASEAIIEHLQAIHDGVLSRVAISVAPGSGKSTLVNVLFPAWQWLSRPGARSIYASHALDLARRDSQRTRRVLSADLYTSLVGGRWTLRPDANRMDLFETTAGGHRIAIGVGGALTGLRAGAGGVIAIDDSLNAIDACSKQARETVNTWFDSAVSTRLDAGQGGIVLVQQRLHSMDLIGHALELGGFESLVLASEYDSGRRCVTSIWQDPRTEEGELLAPAIHSADYLAEQKRILGTAGYSCQYLANPVDDEGGLFPRHHWRFHKPDGVAAASTRRPRGCSDAPAVVLPEAGRVFVSLDAAFKDLQTSDAVCFLVARVVGAERYVIDRRYGRMSFTKTVEVLKDLAEQYRGATFLVEDAANGPAIVNQCRSVVSNIIAVKTKNESKESRAAACSPTVEAHQVFLPDGAEWLGEFIEECAAFPRGKNDDQVDSLSQLLNYAADRARRTPAPIGGTRGTEHTFIAAPSIAPISTTNAPPSIYAAIGAAARGRR